MQKLELMPMLLIKNSLKKTITRVILVSFKQINLEITFVAAIAAYPNKMYIYIYD